MSRSFAGIGDNPVIRVKIDEGLLRDIITSDSYTEAQGDDPAARRVYEHNCNRRELKLFNLMRKLVKDCNAELSNTRIRMRLAEEGEGLYLEIAL